VWVVVSLSGENKRFSPLAFSNSPFDWLAFVGT
jgi:hypothetical protein